jgi:PKD domain
MRVPSWAVAHRARLPVVLVTGLSVLSLAATAIAPATRATGEVAVAATGQFDNYGSPTTFQVTAADDGAGGLTGSLELSGGSLFNGGVTCLAVTGNKVVVGATNPSAGPSGGPLHATLFLTDNGDDGTQDTAALEGPTNMAAADCGSAGPVQTNLTYGQVTILQGSSETGTVSGTGTSAMSGGYGTRTFEFEGARLADGSMSGTYSVSENSMYSTFSTSGTIVCLDIRGSHATIVGQGSNPNPDPYGNPYLYATFFVDDAGPNGAGDTISFNAYSSFPPSGCLAAQESSDEPLITGDIDVNGVGGGGSPAPEATVVASGGLDFGYYQQSFKLAVVSDGAGSIAGSLQLTYGTFFSGTVTCLAVNGSEIVVGAIDPTGDTGGGGGPGGPLYATLWVTDNGPDGTLDTAYIDGPTNMAPPDCSAAAPYQQPLFYGQVTILPGQPEAGSVNADGTNDMGYGNTRTFSFHAIRDADGTVTGTFSITETPSFSLAGAVDCLDIRGTRAILIGHGPYAGGGSGVLYTTVFLEDNGAGGSGDLISFNTYDGFLPDPCLAAQEAPGVGLLSGDIAISTGTTPPPGGPAVLPPGGTLSSDVGGDGPDAGEPIVASVTTPDGGLVQITTISSPTPPASGYGLVGQAFDIIAPPAGGAPLTLVFRVDSTAIPAGDTAATLQVFKDGALVAGCTGAPGTADPDPCVDGRETLVDGDIQLTVLTTTASTWAVGVEGPQLGQIDITPTTVVSGDSVSASALLTDAGDLTGHLVTWDWGDGSTSPGTIPGGSVDSAAVTASHTYTAAGERTITLAVTDPSAQTAQASVSIDVEADDNLDGIVDMLQPSGTPDGSFVDTSLAPPTLGSIVSSNGLALKVTDAPDPGDGVLVEVGNGPAGTQAQLLLCGFTVLLDQGTVTVVTCGSITLAVATGRATVVLGGGLAVVSIPADGLAKIVENGDGTYAITNLGNPGTGATLTLTVDGHQAEIPAGGATPVAAWDFVGFTSPVDNLPVLNKVKAGQAIPLKWRLLDASGAPVTSLVAAGINAKGLDCDLGTTVDLVEEVTSGGSGLQNLGDGYYQLNWKSPKAYAGSCKVLHLDIGDGVQHDAYFKFAK